MCLSHTMMVFWVGNVIRPIGTKSHQSCFNFPSSNSAAGAGTSSPLIQHGKQKRIYLNSIIATSSICNNFITYRCLEQPLLIVLQVQWGEKLISSSKTHFQVLDEHQIMQTYFHYMLIHKFSFFTYLHKLRDESWEYITLLKT